MLIAWVIENLDQFCPFLPLVSYVFKHFEAFWDFPRTLYFFWVEMVVPSFSALFGSPKIFFFRNFKQFFWNFIPFQFILFFSTYMNKLLDYFFKQSILIFDPYMGLLRRQIDRMALILEKFRVLRAEYFSKKLPIPISLISFYIYHVLYFDSLQISVAYKCPYKNTELILEPVYRIAGRLLLVKSGI